MKNFLILLFFIGIISCSSSEDDIIAVSSGPFEIPLENGDYWTYEIQNENNIFNRDSLYVANDTMIMGKAYKKMKVKNDIAYGFYSNSLRNNGIRVDGNRILLSGDLSVDAGPNSPINLDLSLADFVIFDADAPLNANPSSRSGTIQEVIGNYPLTINYTLKSVGGTSFPNFTSPNGDAYTDVKSTKIVLSASITTTQIVFGTNVTIVILPEQNVLVSEQFIAKNIGVVHTNTVTSYTLNSQLPPSLISALNIPATNTTIQNEFLDTYLVN